MIFTFLQSAILAALVFQAELGGAVQLFHGRQKQMFSNSDISNNCDSAFNTTLRCPEAVQQLTYPDLTIGWNTQKLNALCSENCRDDLETLHTNLRQSCGLAVVQRATGNFSLPAIGAFVKHRAAGLCLREEPNGGDFCRNVMKTWDVKALNESGEATWPDNPEKCFYDYDGGCRNLTEITEGEPVENDMTPPPWSFQHKKPQAEDFLRNRSSAIEAAQLHSRGWDTFLNWDEYPLQIQCQRCFWKPFAMAQESRFGHMIWDEVTEQTWQNIVRNCDITGEDAIIKPFRNRTANYPDEPPSEAPPVREPPWEFCSAEVTVPEDNEDNCRQWAFKNGFNNACLQSVNKAMAMSCDKYAMRGRRVCLPPTCETALVDEMMSVQDFVQRGGPLPNGTILAQFLNWNRCVSRITVLALNDSVCIGPRNGVYNPTVVPVPTSTLHTTTATPETSPPPSTIENCGLYHNVSSTDSCKRLSLEYGITVAMLRRMNPSIDSKCTNLTPGKCYCVAPVEDTYVPTLTTTFQPSTTTKTSTRPPPDDPTTTRPPPDDPTTTVKPTKTNNGPQPPAPTREGTTTDCKKWHLAGEQASCWNLQQRYDITLQQLRNWNKYINAQCTNLWADTAICVGIGN